MNAYLPLYRFLLEKDSISIARLTSVRAAAGPRDGQETVTINLRIEETLWGDSNPTARTYRLERPASRHAQLKSPDPVWRLVDLRPGVTILLVAPPAPDAPAPAYVDQIPKPDDPVMQAVRQVLQSDGAPASHDEHFRLRLRWLASGDAVQKLFGGEALARDTLTPQELTQFVAALAGAFTREQDEYVKVSLGSWMWDQVYPRAAEAPQIEILNATMQAISSPSQGARSLALDRLSQADPELLRNPAVKPSADAVRLLEGRRAAETDPGVRDSLSRIIAALRR
jgi:hypothetical protein